MSTTNTAVKVPSLSSLSLPDSDPTSQLTVFPPSSLPSYSPSALNVARQLHRSMPSLTSHTPLPHHLTTDSTSSNTRRSRTMSSTAWRPSQPAFNPVVGSPLRSPSMSTSASPSNPRSTTSPASSRTVPSSQRSQGQSSFVSDVQLGSASAYAFYRGNGIYTRLVPADELPDGLGLVKNQGPEGLVVLPIPGGMMLGDGNGYHTSLSQPSRNGDIQGKIDRIIAGSPPLPAKREKIYCDKWVHEGVCAFTQLGCKYKHEMPLDRATQCDLGLFNGLPSWYRREHAVELRRPSPVTPTSNSAQNTTTGARSGGLVNRFPGPRKDVEQPPVGIQSPRSLRPSPAQYSLGSYGTPARYAAPIHGRGCSIATSNPYGMLSKFDEEEQTD